MVNKQKYNNVKKDIKISSKAKQNYIESNGIYPKYELGYTAVYRITDKLLSLLEDFEIRESFKNKI